MFNPDFKLIKIVFVVLIIGSLSLACGGGGLFGKPPTATPPPTAVVEPTEVPTLEPEATSNPEELTPLETATPDNGVIKSDSTQGMIDNMAQDPILADSKADGTLKKDVLQSLVDSTYKEGCIYSFTKVTVTKAPKNTKSSWEEEWKMGICDKATTLKIVFTPDPNGGTNFAVTTK
jgi:hypothetical protein